MTKKQKRILKRIIISAILTAIALIVPTSGFLRFILFMIPYAIIGYDILKKAFFGIINKQLLDENFLMAIATIGAIIIGITTNGDYTEAVFVMLFYQIGELFQSYAVGKSRKSISELMNIRPDYANVETDSKIVRVSPEEISVGSVIIIQPGEKIPIDGIIENGVSSLDTSMLTGESMPRDVFVGDSVLSGAINLSGVLRVRTTKVFLESTASKILDLVENASSNKSKSENFISRFARVYTPVVCILALILAVAPPVFELIFFNNISFSKWLYRALTFLVVSCPCALVISIPLTFFAGIGGASKAGILVKGSNYLEALSMADTVIFDKTGTLTQGTFEVSKIYSVQDTPELLLEYAALAESSSSHPIAQSLKKAYGKELDINRVADIKEVSGMGIKARVDNKNIKVGNRRFCPANVNIEEDINAVLVHIEIDGDYSGYIKISDSIKPQSKKAIEMLKKSGIKRTVILTGDTEQSAENIADTLEIGEYFAELLPDEKVSKTEEIIKSSNKKVIFVGDGINDAPVLSRADIGIAMGAKGADAAIESADIVLMDDNPQNVSNAIRLSKKVLAIVYQNTIFAILIKFICLFLTAIGIGNMWLAIFADVGVMVLAVINASRAFCIKLS